MSEIKVRLAKEGDIPFIYNTWLYAYWNGNHEAGRVKKDLFMREYTKVITAVLSKPSTIVNIACLSDDENIIAGYAVIDMRDKKALHFAYIKKMWRGHGIYPMIVPEVEAYTHITGQFLKTKAKDLIYNPFLIGN